MSENYGWVCPLCKRVNAPWVSQCPCCDDGSYPKVIGPCIPYTPDTSKGWWEEPPKWTCVVVSDE